MGSVVRVGQMVCGGFLRGFSTQGRTARGAIPTVLLRDGGKSTIRPRRGQAPQRGAARGAAGHRRNRHRDAIDEIGCPWFPEGARGGRARLRRLCRLRRFRRKAVGGGGFPEVRPVRRQDERTPGRKVVPQAPSAAGVEAKRETTDPATCAWRGPRENGFRVAGCLRVRPSLRVPSRTRRSVVTRRCATGGASAAPGRGGCR